MNNEDFEISPALDRERNEALVNADITKSYEEFLAIFDRSCAEDVVCERYRSGPADWQSERSVTVHRSTAFFPTPQPALPGSPCGVYCFCAVFPIPPCRLF